MAQPVPQSHSKLDGSWGVPLVPSKLDDETSASSDGAPVHSDMYSIIQVETPGS